MIVTNGTKPAAESIAVIGVRGRFPGAASVEELWDNLKNGMESISTFSEPELRAAGIDPAYLNVPGFVSRGCVLDNIDLFDAAFFGYSARDAETIDPQQRIFMEMAWESLEEAGYDADTYPGMIGVFAGSDQSTYLYQIYQNVDLSAYGYGGMMSIGNEKDYVATQVSYKLNLRGPSMAIQTSCSTSLVTVCMACQSLLCGSCDMALAGGVAINVPQRRGYWYQPGGIVSPDGHCRPFDAAGQGTVVGNGAGIVLLKRLSEAIADGDRIQAVIKGFGMNNDGAAKVGYTAPSVDGQAQAIRMAQRMAGSEPESIGYIEAHGTATALGDPIEMAALTKVFRERTKKKQFCAIGSLKSNVGHLSSSAGVAGLIKGILTVRHGQVPKSLHYEAPNPQIDFKNSPFFVPSGLIDWPVMDGPRRAGVSSFGVGGTNAHVILEEAPPVERVPEAPENQLLTLSARSAGALEKVTNNLIGSLEKNPELDLADIAYTCQIGRKAFPHRRTAVFNRADREGLITSLKSRDPQRVLTSYTEMRDRTVVFMFSGQGTQYVDMGRELYETEPTFRENVDTCSAILKGEMNIDLREYLYPDRDREHAQERLKQTSITQPALFTLEYSLARLWMEWGIMPRAMVGHSIGEYVAACIAGVMDLPEALGVVAMRGRLMQEVPGGSMLAVSLPEAALQPLLGPHLSLAAVNAPTLCVLSGITPAIEALEKQFSEQGLMCRRLQTSHAFHSSMMDPIIRQFVDRLSRVKLKPPQIAYLSNVTGAWIRPELATSPQYWGTHLRQTVRFADNLRETMVFPDLVLLEVGPGQTLGFLARQQGSRSNSQLILSSVRSAQEEGSDSEFLRNTVGRLWMGGVRIDWRGFHAHEKRQRVSLPTYPFERQRFWLGPLEQAEAPAADGVSAAAQTQSSGAAYATAAASSYLSAPASTTGPVSLPSVNTDLAEWFFAPSWKPSVAAFSSADGASAGPWLLFSDSAGIGENIAARLRDSGREAAIVVRGDGFSAEDGRFTVRPGERADYEELIKSLRERKQYPTRILHLWSLDDAPAGTPEFDAFNEAQRRSFYSIAHLAQAIGKKGEPGQLQLGIVTDRLQSVTGDEELRSLEGTVFGACKVVPQEYPNIHCRLIDIVRSQPGVSESLLKELTNEPFAAVVAYRNARRWVQQFEPVRLVQPEAHSGLLRDGGVYLITGGLGNIALVLADAIASQIKAKFILSGRSPFPGRSQWDEHAAAHPNDQTTARIRKLRALEKLGSEVMIAQADAANRAQMAELTAEAARKWGRINGVIHGAANLSPDAFGPIRELDATKGDSHFRPKAQGLLILEDILREDPPDFYVLLSSLSAVLGGLGLGAYAASNAFLDVEAQRRNQAGKSVWITTNWDAWDFSLGAKPLSDAISASQGREAFTRILASPLRHVVISTSALSARLDKWVNLQHASTPVRVAVNGAGAAAQPGSSGSVHARPDLSTQYAGPRNEAEKMIVEVWEHLLGVSPIGIYDKFFELGGHSLLAIQLLGRLREIFELDLPVQRIFEAPTVAQLAESIERDKQAEGAAGTLSSGDDEKLQEMLSLVEGLSEEELDDLLKEAESIERGKEAYGGSR